MYLAEFFLGLTFFCLGLAATLEVGRSSKLALAGEMHWLAGFGFTQSLYGWCDFFQQFAPASKVGDALFLIRTISLPVSALLLVRFGIGLIEKAGPLPEWLTLMPVVLIVPISLLLGYGLIIAITQAPRAQAADVWSRYLLYFPGSLLAAFGCYWQWHTLKQNNLPGPRRMLLGAMWAFIANSLLSGLVVPQSTYGLAAWLNEGSLQSLSAIPIEYWRLGPALAITIFITKAMGVFEAEQQQNLIDMREAQQNAIRKSLEDQTEARHTAERWTDALVGISRRIADMENVDAVLLSVVEIARRLLNADSAVLALWDETGSRLEVKCSANSQSCKSEKSMVVENSLILDAIRSRKSTIYPDGISDKAGGWICPICKNEIQAAAIVALQLENEPIGGLWVGRLTNSPFSSTELVELEHLADQAVIAIEHALMASRLQSLAVVEERSRIAREMHDGLAQILGYLGLENQTLEALVQRKDWDAALNEIQQARQQIAIAQDDVRENILSLRTTLAGDAGLLPSLEEFLQEFSLQTGIEAVLVNNESRPPILSPMAEAQLVRIIQEALSNIRKHAYAKRVQVRLAIHENCLCVTITDDGMGFDNTPGPGHYGLITMRERAEGVSGGLTINSEIGVGTQVEVWLPLIQS
jgi:signal transduction histidine kinase